LDCYEGVTLVDCLYAGIGWTYAAGVFSPPPRSLAEAVADKLIQIEHERDAACIVNVTAHGRTWQADKVSQDLLSGEIMTTLSGTPMSPIWRDADNDNMPLTHVQQLIDIAAAIKVQKFGAYATSWTRKAAVAVASSVEEVEAA
jgi:hypothetical protein